MCSLLPCFMRLQQCAVQSHQSKGRGRLPAAASPLPDHEINAKFAQTCVSSSSPPRPVPLLTSRAQPQLPPPRPALPPPSPGRGDVCPPPPPGRGPQPREQVRAARAGAAPPPGRPGGARGTSRVAGPGAARSAAGHTPGAGRRRARLSLGQIFLIDLLRIIPATVGKHISTLHFLTF